MIKGYETISAARLFSNKFKLKIKWANMGYWGVLSFNIFVKVFLICLLHT